MKITTVAGLRMEALPTEREKVEAFSNMAFNNFMQIESVFLSCEPAFYSDIESWEDAEYDLRWEVNEWGMFSIAADNLLYSR